MARQFSATILLRRPWSLDMGALIDHARSRFPQIGRIDRVAGQTDNHEAGLMTLDDAKVVVMCINAPLVDDQLTPPLKILRIWDAEPAVDQHFAQVTVSCGAELAGVDGAKAIAAATHFIAAAVTEMTDPLAVFWPESWTLTRPDDFVDATGTILDGRTPLGVWASFATIVPRGFDAAEATGIVSYGLRPLIGRELELAPAPIEGKVAYRRIAAISRAALDRGATLGDGQALVDPDRTYSMMVRERGFWLRRGTPAYVLIGQDSVIDPVTLRPVGAEVA